MVSTVPDPAFVQRKQMEEVLFKHGYDLKMRGPPPKKKEKKQSEQTNTDFLNAPKGGPETSGR